MMVMYQSWLLKSEYASKDWRETVVVNLFKKGNKSDQGCYRRITLQQYFSKHRRQNIL